MRKYTLIAILAVTSLLIAAPAQAQPQSVASQTLVKHTKKGKKKQRQTKTLVPHTAEVQGELVAICDVGYCPGFAVYSAVSFADCPDGYWPISGGWETYGNDAPRNATVTENHTVSANWLVVMEVPPPTTPFTQEFHIAHFRATAVCMTLRRE